MKTWLRWLIGFAVIAVLFWLALLVGGLGAPEIIVLLVALVGWSVFCAFRPRQRN